jgi:AcrR family transcriptional regulator
VKPRYPGPRPDPGDGATTLTSTPGRPAAASRDRRPGGPGRPRSEQAEEAILDAVFDLFADGIMYSAMSMEMIASAAGVGKATIYRRWPNKEALVIDAVDRRMGFPGQSPPGRAVREDLIFLVEEMRTRLCDERTGAVWGMLMHESRANPQLLERYQRDVIEPRREIFRQVLRRGIASGELRADLDVERTVAMLTGPVLLLTRLYLPPTPVTAEFSTAVVDDLLRGMGA